jgi:hypothetical protein
MCHLQPAILNKSDYSTDYGLANSGPTLIAQSNMFGLGNSIGSYGRSACEAEFSPFIPAPIGPPISYKFSWEK